ncbi:MAG: bifunctional folylpolyglutamate synthase/dihydrofolate synthase, partial [Pseudomonadales bacterium]
MRFSNLNAWLHWLEQLHPVEIDLGLDRVLAVAKHLNLLSFSATVITVAGTNGKGSTVAALQALLSQSSSDKPRPRVGVYTSPHLINFTERVMLDDKPVDEALLCQALEQVDQARISTSVSLSYFEFTTLAALVIFSQTQLDYILLEVGLGGRLDAVNVVDADVAVITQIDIDHESWLGSNREVIAVEKAGILRAHQIAVIADNHPPKSLQDKVASLACNVCWAKGSVVNIKAISHGFSSASGDDGHDWHGVGHDGSAVTIADLPLPKLARESWSAALQVALMLDVLPTADICKRLLATVQLAGRLSVVEYNDRVILLDVAHNRQSVERLADYLVQNSGDDSSLEQKWVAIFAVMADKDIGAMLDCTLPLIKKWYLPALQHCPR